MRVPYLSVHTVVLREMEETRIRTRVLSFLMWAEASVMRFIGSTMMLDFNAYTRYFICPQR